MLLSSLVANLSRGDVAGVSELKRPVPAQLLQPTFSSCARGSLTGIKLLPYLFSHQINDSNLKVGLLRVLCPNGTNRPSLHAQIFKGISVHSSPSLLLALEEPQKL